LVTGLGWRARGSGGLGLLDDLVYDRSRAAQLRWWYVDERTAVLTVDADMQALEDQRALLTDAAGRSRLSAPEVTDKRYPRLVHLLALNAINLCGQHRDQWSPQVPRESQHAQRGSDRTPGLHIRRKRRELRCRCNDTTMSTKSSRHPRSCRRHTADRQRNPAGNLAAGVVTVVCAQVASP
jgi:hypothetical protein